jgi:hypothetical protein
VQLNKDERNAATRARWLAELANAIESAQQLAWQLGTASRPSAEARDLYGRLEAARVEVESMQGAGALSRDSSPAPVWLDALGLSGALLDTAE